MMSYYYVFSISPILILMNVVISKLNISTESVERLLETLMPEKYSSIISDYLESISGTTTGLITATAVMLTVYSVSRVVRVLRKRIRLLYGNAFDIRTAASDWILSFLFSFLLLLAIIISLFIMVLGKELVGFLADKLGFSDFFVNLWLILRFAIIAALIFFVLLAIYYVLPGVKQRPSDCIVGTVSGMASWVLFTAAFSFYVDNMKDYSVVYGSLGAIIVLLLWLFFSNTVILGGALINSMIWQKRHTVVDQKTKPADAANSKERDKYL